MLFRAHGITVLLMLSRIIHTLKPPPETPSYYSDTAASASWSTQDQSLSHMPQRPTEILAKKADLESSASLRPYNQSLALRPHGREREFLPRSAIAESVSEARTQVYIKVPATLQGHTGWVWGVAFSPDGKLISSPSYQTVRLWDPATGAARATLQGHTGEVRGVRFSPDGKLIASSSDDKTVRLWDPATSTVIAKDNTVI